MIPRLITALLVGTALVACGSQGGATTPAATTPAAASTATSMPSPAATTPPEPSAVATATSTTAAAATTTAPDDPGAAVFRAFVDAVNNGNASAAAELFTPDASWQRGGQCPPRECVGIERLRQEIERDVANHHRLSLASTEALGSTVTARVELQTDQTRAAGVERIVQIFTVTIVDQRIATFQAANDMNDAATATFMRQRRGQ